MNDYDKAGRYLVKRESEGFFHYLLGNPRISFRAWIDARRVALPDQHDLTNDLVAALESGGVLEAVCLELEAEARADAVTRSLEYQTRLWTEPLVWSGLASAALPRLWWNAHAWNIPPCKAYGWSGIAMERGLRIATS